MVEENRHIQIFQIFLRQNELNRCTCWLMCQSEPHQQCHWPLTGLTHILIGTIDSQEWNSSNMIAIGIETHICTMALHAAFNRLYQQSQLPNLQSFGVRSSEKLYSPGAMVHPLTKQFNGWLRPILLTQWHVQIVNKYDAPVANQQ